MWATGQYDSQILQTLQNIDTRFSQFVNLYNSFKDSISNYWLPILGVLIGCISVILVLKWVMKI